jgi:hypothetical protein
MTKIELTPYELELLKLALPYAEKLAAEGEVMTRDGLRRELSCGKDIASRLKQYIRENKALTIAGRLKAIPARAETRAEVNVALGVPVGTTYSHVVRENVRLQRALAKANYVAENEKEARMQLMRAEVEELMVTAKEELAAVRKPKKTAKVIEGDLMLEIATPDLHVGKLAHTAETGRRPYDVKIAIATFNRALDGLIERTKNYAFSKILFVAGNDLFNSDNEDNTTTGGTQVDTDGRFFKTFRHTRKMIVTAIERLRQIAPVQVVVVPGNHDRQTAYHLGDSLECYFHADPMVTVDNLPNPRKYVEHGRVLLGFCHGDEGKIGDYASLMAIEQPEAWGRTKFREIHCGHFHSLKVTEDKGVRTRLLSALTEADSWHTHMGYIGAIRQAEAFVWSKKEGLLAECFWNEDAQEPIITETEVNNA